MRRRSAGEPSTIRSAMRLVAPMTLDGRTALSVEISTNSSAPYAAAASATHQRAEDVVPHRLADVVLHHRHVLVRGGVKDEVRAVRANTSVHPRLVGHVGDHRDDLDARVAAAQLQVDEVERALGPLDQQQPCRPSAATWRASSEPIEPAPPVIITVFPAQLAARGQRSSSTASRPSRSSISTSRIWLSLAPP